MPGEWVVVRVAPDQLSAEMWVYMLRDEGVPALIRPSDAVSFLGTTAMGCRIMVPEEHLSDAEALLEEHLTREIEDP